jgi:hypothetical protein
MRGDLSAGYDEGMAAAALVPYIFAPVLAMRCAIWSGDPERARRAEAYLVAAVDRGRSVGANRRLMEAGLAALEGRLDEASAGYRAAATTLRDLDATLDLAFCLVDHATLIGPRDRAALAAADEAREILARIDCPPLLERLASGVGHRPSEAASTASRKAVDRRDGEPADLPGAAGA